MASEYMYKAPPPKNGNWWARRVNEVKTLQEGLFAESRPIVYAGRGEETSWDGKDGKQRKQKDLDALALREMRGLRQRQSSS